MRNKKRKNKNRRKYKDGELVYFEEKLFRILNYSYPSMEYILEHESGLCELAKQDELQIKIKVR